MLAMSDAFIAGIFVVGSAVVTGIFGVFAAIKARKEAAIAAVNSEKIREQVVPSNGTKLYEYIERNDERLDNLIKLIQETRDTAVRAEAKLDTHLSETTPLQSAFLDHLQRPDAHHLKES